MEDVRPTKDDENPLSLRERDRVRVGLFSGETPMPLGGTKEHENRQEPGEIWVPGFSLDRELRLKPNTHEGFSGEKAVGDRREGLCAGGSDEQGIKHLTANLQDIDQ